MNGPFGLPGSGPIHRWEARELLGWLPRGFIDGFTLSNDGTDATNDIAIAAGACRSTVNSVDGVASTLARDQIDMEIPVSIIKQLDVSWEPENYDPAGYSGGGRSGMRDPLASISDATWHIYVVGGGDNQTDVMAIASATQATVLASVQAAGFTAYRRVGSIIRSSGAIVVFVQDGDRFLLSAPVQASADSGDHTAGSTVTIPVPTGVRVTAILSMSINDNTTGGSEGTLVNSTLQANPTPSNSAAPGLSLTGRQANAFMWTPYLEIVTDTSAQIRFKASHAAIDVRIILHGWIEQRGRNS